MSRHDEAMAFLQTWDPDAEVLPDWVADALDDHDDLRERFDARFTPWDAGDLALPAPVARRRPWRGIVVGLLAAGLAVTTVAGTGSLFVMTSYQHELPVAFEEPVSLATAADDGEAAVDEQLRMLGYVVEEEEDEKELDPRRTAAIRNKDDAVAVTDLPRLEPPEVPGRVVVQSQKIEIVPRVQFHTDSTRWSTGAEGVVDEVAQVLRDHPELPPVVIEGHAAPGEADVSLERANAVKAALVARGVPADRLRVEGRGEAMPLAPGDDPRNRRVEFRVSERAPAPVPEPPSSEDYTDYGHHAFQLVSEDPLSTFAADVDTASFTLSRRKLEQGYLPPTAAVRVEEFVNWLPYDYTPPADGSPFSVALEGAPNPFNPRTHWVRVGVQGKKVAVDQRTSVHLTFLVDTSGSMQSDDKLGLVKTALKALTGELRDGDTVALVAYAGSAGVILEPTPMSRRDEVLRALDRLTAGGSTAMGAGIELAYSLAEQSYHEGGVNRVVILSDGDANVGVTSHEALVELIRGYARQGITLTTAGFGQGNYKDTMMERLANDGDGNYWYIDSEREARRVFVDKLTSTLVVIAKDVKLQVEWDPDTVEAYRLVGYENRDVADRDFRNDAVDAGEIGAGHQVTALYEVALREGATSDHLATVRVRNKAPGPEAPASERRFELDRAALRPSFEEAGGDLRMAVAAAGFAELLRGSPHLHGAGYDDVAGIARAARRPEYAEDGELIGLIERAGALSR